MNNAIMSEHPVPKGHTATSNNKQTPINFTETHTNSTPTTIPNDTYKSHPHPHPSRSSIAAQLQPSRSPAATQPAASTPSGVEP
ncbi:MAG: hypothetical protein ACI9K5_002284 [Gammaproteobacteria bacterium]|jgi:hypothetical protein